MSTLWAGVPLVKCEGARAGEGAGPPGAVGGRLARVAPFIHVLLGTTLVFGDSEPTVRSRCY